MEGFYELTNKLYNMPVRIVELQDKDAFYNTAADEVIFDFVRKGLSPPTILITNWKPTVSIGKTQSYAADVDAENCLKYGIDVVRRFSGGKSAYLDDDYSTVSFIMRGQVSDIRRKTCESVVDTLQKYGVPAAFAEPDNVVVYENGRMKQLGSSGQRIVLNSQSNIDAFYSHMNVRYNFGEDSFMKMLAVLKVAGEPLHPYIENARQVLAAVRNYSTVPKVELAKAIAKNLAKNLVDQNPYYENFSENEDEAIIEQSKELRKDEWLRDTPICKPQGPCYFFIGGKNLLPMRVKEIAPSTDYDALA